jgi:hypothetical protein
MAGAVYMDFFMVPQQRKRSCACAMPLMGYIELGMATEASELLSPLYSHVSRIEELLNVEEGDWPGNDPARSG